MKTGNSVKHEETDTKRILMDSAKRIFLECGFQAAPLRRIASEAGFTPGALYGYFNSKEDLFYALTDPVAERLMNKLNKVRSEMEDLPEEKKLYEMGSVYYKYIPEIVDILISDRDALRLIVSCSKGTGYEGFIDNIAGQNAVNITMAAENTEDKSIKSVGEETMEVLMDGYIRTLFRLVLSDRDRDSIIRCMEMIGKIYEAGIISLMKRGE